MSTDPRDPPTRRRAAGTHRDDATTRALSSAGRPPGPYGPPHRSVGPRGVAGPRARTNGPAGPTGGPRVRLDEGEVMSSAAVSPHLLLEHAPRPTVPSRPAPRL